MYTDQANILEGPNQDVSLTRLTQWVNINILMSRLEWSRRTYGSILYASYDALVYMDADLK